MSVPAGYRQTEAGVIPEDWDTVPLGSLFTFKNGLNKAKQFFGHGTPIVNYMDVFRYPALRMTKVAGRVEVNKAELDRYSVQQGDVFFTRTSETVEEVGIASTMLDAPENTVFSGFVLRARPKGDDLVDQFKAYALRSPAVRDQIIAKATYTTRALTNGGTLSAIYLAKPTKPEQSAIAEALLDMDEAIAAQEAVIAKKRALKTATIQALLSGTRRLTGFSGEWSIAQLDKIGRFSKGSGLPKNDLLGFGSLAAIPYAAIYTDFEGIIERNQIKNFTSSALRTVVIDSPRLLIAGSSNMLENVGKAVAYNDSNRVAVGGDVLIFETHQDVGFLAYLLSTQHHRQRIVSLAQGSTIRHVYPSTFFDYQIRLPDRKEQQGIVATIKASVDDIRTQEAILAKLRLLKSGMTQQLLTGRIRLV